MRRFTTESTCLDLFSPDDSEKAYFSRTHELTKGTETRKDDEKGSISLSYIIDS